MLQIQPELEVLLEKTTNLPSLPGVALKIVQLTNDPYTTIDDVAEALEKDPALAVKILRVVNSAVYPTRSEIESLRQAIVIIGLAATQSLALSFSLLGSLQNDPSGGLDYPLYWRRSLLAGCAARRLGELVGERDLEALFLAALLQDIGMLVLTRMKRDFYAGLNGRQLDHQALMAFEKQQIGCDHALVGGWLLRQWNFHKRTILAVELSHGSFAADPDDNQAKFRRCVGLSGRVADLLLADGDERHYDLAVRYAHSNLNIDAEQFDALLQRVLKLIPALESLFDTRLLEREKLAMIESMAREALQRHMQQRQHTAAPK